MFVFQISSEKRMRNVYPIKDYENFIQIGHNEILIGNYCTS